MSPPTPRGLLAKPIMTTPAAFGTRRMLAR
jgi:hypothetical protein